MPMKELASPKRGDWMAMLWAPVVMLMRQRAPRTESAARTMSGDPLPLRAVAPFMALASGISVMSFTFVLFGILISMDQREKDPGWCTVTCVQFPATTAKTSGDVSAIPSVLVTPENWWTSVGGWSG